MESVQKFEDANRAFIDQSIYSKPEIGFVRSSEVKNSISSINECSNGDGSHKPSANCITSFVQKIWSIITSIFQAIFFCGKSSKTDSLSDQKSKDNEDKMERSRDILIQEAQTSSSVESKIEGQEFLKSDVLNLYKENPRDELGSGHTNFIPTSNEALISTIDSNTDVHIPGQEKISEFESILKNKNLKLYEFYKENGIFVNCAKKIEIDIESLNGLYGINLDEVGLDDWQKDESLPTLSLSPCVNDFKFDLLKENNLDENAFVSTTISYREAFQYVIKWINFHIDLKLNKNELTINKSKDCNERLIRFKDHIVYNALTNIIHSRKDLATGIPRDEHDGEISWFTVICQVLKDKKLIFNVYDRSGYGTFIQC